ncbi:MAG: hypothetical protein U9Q19_02655 [Pseudomonadota bacterium]|nr:hypothetical protein [Pseudomonadota bacterium]
MAKRVDPDDFTIDVNGTPTTEEVAVLTGVKTVELRVAGNLDDTAPGKTSGATGRAIYSFLKEEWLANSTLRRFKFPIKMIFEGSFIWVNGWAPANAQTRDLFRDCGFLEQVSSNENACMISLGSMNAPGSDLAYYTQASGWTAATTDYDKTGELNENIDITGATTFKKSFLRVQGKIYSEYNLLSEYGISAITYQAYSFPLTNLIDQKINETDGNIDTIGPYTGMKVNYLLGSSFTTWANTTVYAAGAVVLDAIRQSGGSSNGTWWFTPAGGTSSGTGTADDVGVTDWEAYDGEEQIGDEWFAFNRVVTCNAGTDQETYNYLMRQLRLTTDINANDTTSINQRGFGVVNGEVAALLCDYVGDSLRPRPGVLLRGFDTNSTNNILHSDITVDGGGLDTESLPATTTQRAFPFVAAGNYNFSQNLVDELDVETVYTVYFEYITTTAGSYTLTLNAGSTGDLTWASTDLDHIIATDYVHLSGFATTPAMDGLYLVDSVGANTMQITHQEGVTIITETATITVLENPFESPGAVIVNDNGGTPMDAQITAGTIAWDFDYTNNVQGGRTADTDAAIHVVAQALDGAEWTEATHTITKATGQNIPVNAGDELNFSNPV